MAPDFAFHYLSSPLGVGLLLAILVLPTAFVRGVAKRSFQRLGLRLIAQGYCAVIAANFLLSVLMVLLGGGSMERAQYVFILSLIFVLPLASFVVFPNYVWLSRRGAATVGLFAAAGVM